MITKRNRESKLVFRDRRSGLAFTWHSKAARRHGTSSFSFPLDSFDTRHSVQLHGEYLIIALINLSTAGIPPSKNTAMQTTVGKHIEQLQERREKLNAYLMNSKLNRVQRNRIEAEIRWVDLALDRFRAALAAEKKVPASRAVGN